MLIIGKNNPNLLRVILCIMCVWYQAIIQASADLTVVP